MKDLKSVIKSLKEETRGAACFYDPDTREHSCYNGLTKSEAMKAANETGVELYSWNAGKSCSQVKCP